MTKEPTKDRVRQNKRKIPTKDWESLYKEQKATTRARRGHTRSLILPTKGPRAHAWGPNTPISVGRAHRRH